MFKKIAIMLSAAVLSFFPVAAQANPPVKAPEVRYIVKDDPGGSVQDFISALIAAKQSNMKFKIDGFCASACTLILATPLKLDLCVTPNAVFKFHQPFAMDGRGKIAYNIPSVVGAQKLWENLFLASYPSWVQSTIKENGGVPNVYTGAKQTDTFDIKVDILKANMKVCD